MRRRVLKHRFPNTRVYSDVNYVDVPYDLRFVNLIVGGFPCQDTSHAGLQEGLDGKRSSLFFEFIRIIRILRPWYVIVENVAGLRNAGMGRVIGALAALGYVGEWDCIPASILGAPHERDRVWIVGHLPFEARCNQNALSIQRAWNLADPGALPFGGSHQPRRLPQPPWHSTGSRRPNGPLANDLVDLPAQVVSGNPEVIFCPHALAAFAEICQSSWSSEPALDRVVDGLPAGMDGRAAAAITDDSARASQVAALGDSLIPHIPAFLGIRIRNHARHLSLQ